MKTRTLAVSLATSGLLLAACGTGTNPTTDGGRDAGTIVGGNDAGPTPSCGGGRVRFSRETPTGTFTGNFAVADANIDPSLTGGTLSCQAAFDAQSGVDGSWIIQCFVVGQDRAVEVWMNGLGRPTPASFPLGLAATSFGADGGREWNGVVTFHLSEWPACESSAVMRKTWYQAIPGGNLVVDSINGTEVAFHLTDTALQPIRLAGEQNFATGTLRFSGAGRVTMSGL